MNKPLLVLCLGTLAMSACGKKTASKNADGTCNGDFVTAFNETQKALNDASVAIELARSFRSSSSAHQSMISALESAHGKCTAFYSTHSDVKCTARRLLATENSEIDSTEHRENCTIVDNNRKAIENLKKTLSATSILSPSTTAATSISKLTVPQNLVMASVDEEGNCLDSFVVQYREIQTQSESISRAADNARLNLTGTSKDVVNVKMNALSKTCDAFMAQHPGVSCIARKQNSTETVTVSTHDHSLVCDLAKKGI